MLCVLWRQENWWNITAMAGGGGGLCQARVLREVLEHILLRIFKSPRGTRHVVKRCGTRHVVKRCELTGRAVKEKKKMFILNCAIIVWRNLPGGGREGWLLRTIYVGSQLSACFRWKSLGTGRWGGKENMKSWTSMAKEASNSLKFRDNIWTKCYPLHKKTIHSPFCIRSTYFQMDFNMPTLRQQI